MTQFILRPPQCTLHVYSFLICLQSNNNLKLYQINISKYSFFAIFSKGLCITHCPFLIRTLNTRISYQFGFRHYLSSHAPTFSLKKKVQRNAPIQLVRTTSRIAISFFFFRYSQATYFPGASYSQNYSNDPNSKNIHTCIN